MKISTKGRYALRILIDFAEHSGDKEYIALKDVASRQDISLKYLEKILPMLVKGKLIEGVHGKGGGYKLLRKPAQYSVGEILRLTEGDLSPVACLGPEADENDQIAESRTIGMWKKFYEMTNNYFDSITLDDLMEKDGLRSELISNDFEKYAGL